MQIKINPKDQFTVSKQALVEILQSYNISTFEHELPKGGVSNTNLIIKIAGVKKYVLRILRKNKKTLEEIRLEINFQNFLVDNSLPVPRIILNIEGEPITLFNDDKTIWQCILFKFAQGNHPEVNDFTRNPEFLRDLAYKQAEQYNIAQKYNGQYEKRMLTSLSQTSSPKIIENLIKDIELCEIKNRSLVEIIDQRMELYSSLEGLDLTYSLIHDDINITNILVLENRVTAILDFDELYHGPVMSCVVNTAFEFLRFSNDPSIALKYISYFQKGFKLKSDDLLITKSLLLLRNLMFIVYLIRFHGEDFEHISTHINLIEKLQSL